MLCSCLQTFGSTGERHGSFLLIRILASCSKTSSRVQLSSLFMWAPSVENCWLMQAREQEGRQERVQGERQPGVDTASTAAAGKVAGLKTCRAPHPVWQAVQSKSGRLPNAQGSLVTRAGGSRHHHWQHTVCATTYSSPRNPTSLAQEADMQSARQGLMAQPRLVLQNAAAVAHYESSPAAPANWVLLQNHLPQYDDAADAT